MRLEEGAIRGRHQRIADLPPLPLVPAHGDFGSHNWLVDGSGAVRVIDYANSGRHPAAYDLARLLAGPAWGHPERLARFLDGYGAHPTAAEQRFVELHLGFNAAVALAWSAGRGPMAPRRRAEEIMVRLAADDLRFPDLAAVGPMPTSSPR